MDSLENESGFSAARGNSLPNQMKRIHFFLFIRPGVLLTPETEFSFLNQLRLEKLCLDHLVETVLVLAFFSKTHFNHVAMSCRFEPGRQLGLSVNVTSNTLVATAILPRLTLQGPQPVFKPRVGGHARDRKKEREGGESLTGVLGQAATWAPLIADEPVFSLPSKHTTPHHRRRDPREAHPASQIPAT